MFARFVREVRAENGERHRAAVVPLALVDVLERRAARQDVADVERAFVLVGLLAVEDAASVEPEIEAGVVLDALGPVPREPRCPRGP